jgi:hypothetical protein
VLDEVLERASAIDQRRQYQEQQQQQQQQQQQAAQTTNSVRPIPYDVGPPPDDYQLLPIVPSVTEILSEEQSYLRRNIVDGVYEDARHYLDVSSFVRSLDFEDLCFPQVHFRLLREDFIAPLREGIQQYLSGAEGKNFNVRIYEDVRLLGSRLCRRSGLVYDLRLNPEMAAKISWANSRRLMFGNLLVLTFDQFQSCAFAMVEDRSAIEKNFIISVNNRFYSKYFFMTILPVRFVSMACGTIMFPLLTNNQDKCQANTDRLHCSTKINGQQVTNYTSILNNVMLFSWL